MLPSHIPSNFRGVCDVCRHHLLQQSHFSPSTFSSPLLCKVQCCHLAARMMLAFPLSTYHSSVLIGGHLLNLTFRRRQVSIIARLANIGVYKVIHNSNSLRFFPILAFQSCYSCLTCAFLTTRSLFLVLRLVLE